MASLHKPIHELRHRDVPVSGFDEGAGVSFATYNDAVIEKFEKDQVKKREEWAPRVHVARVQSVCVTPGFDQRVGELLSAMDTEIVAEQAERKRK